jgi:hypothetical protein
MMAEQAAMLHFCVAVLIIAPTILWETAHGSPQKTAG